MRATLTAILLFTAIPLFADYNQALELYKNGKYQDSLKSVADTLEVAKDNDPKSENYQLRYIASHNHRKLGNTASAIIHLQKCAEIKPKAVEPLIDLAFLMFDTGKFKDATAYGQKIITLDPKNALGYYILGFSSYKQGVFWGAKEYLEKSTSYDPELYIAWNALGLTLMYLKKYPDADTAFATALAMNPDTAEVLNNLAVAELREGKVDQAKKTIAKASSIAPANDKIKKNKEILDGMKK
jgi:tetratricopeptide (TPR) repeat protein